MIRIMKQHLQEALKGLSKVVCTKTSLPILSCVRITTGKESVTVSGTDLDQWMECQVPAEVAEPMDCIVSLEGLREFIDGGDTRNMVCIAAAGKNIRLSMDVAGQSMERSLHAMPMDDWPPSKAQPKTMTPVTKDIFGIMKLAYPSASKDDTRRTLTGICLDKNAVIATDGSQLVKLNFTLPLKEQVILPPTKVLVSGFFKDDGMMGVVMEKKDITHVNFQSGAWRYTLRCIVANYPNFNQVIPKDEDLKNRIVFTAEDISMLEKSVPKIEGYKDDQQGIVMYAGRNGVKFMSRQPSSSVKIDTKAEYKGMETMAAMNRNYVMRALELGFTEFRFCDAYSPFMASGKAGIYVFMPMRNVRDIESCWKKLGITPNKEANMSEKKAETAVAGSKAETQPAAPKTGMQFKPQEQTTPAADTFEELRTAAEGIRQAAKALADSAVIIQRKIADAQRAVKLKEKDYKETRDLIERIRAKAA
ncbi:MAG TPA: hypothetical protein DET40_05090 [Lentisphaeria bacterium]|nr:MAG: hypothetical protein A2X45_13665 [Lentisphaerae bacterium GWF2_50_93]HCE42902.1 hypothetical protein [Lentisphaeria bacterium]